MKGYGWLAFGLLMAGAGIGCEPKETSRAAPTSENGAGGAAGAGGGGASCVAEQSGTSCGEIPTTGVCACGNKVQYCNSPPPTDDGIERPPTLVTVACGADKACQVDEKGVASCVLTKACQAGEAKCDGDTLQVCRADGSGYDATDCQASGKECRAQPKKPAQCINPLAEAAGTGTSLRGCVEFERRRMEKTGPSQELIVEKAWFQLVAVYNGSNYIGSSLSDENGCFAIELTEPANADTDVYVFALDIDPKTEQPLVAVARAAEDSIDTRTATEYWSWSNKAYDARVQPAGDPNAPGAFVMPTFRVREQDGSGAIRIFQWIRYGLYRLNYTFEGKDYGLEATKGKKQDSLLVFWSPGIAPPCGSCFLGRNGGGANVTLEGGDDSYDTMMFISGTTSSPAHWSSSVLAHEFGHWTMANYSKPPGEGGRHYVNQVSKPGLAWSEGWATAFGQWHISDPDKPEYDPLYIDTQQDTTFWVDIAKASTQRGNLPLPDPTAGIDQYINENVVSALVWHMWQPAAAGSGPYQGLGEEVMFRTLQQPRIVKLNRGYIRTDLVDFLDAGRCSGDVAHEAISAVATQFQFPWDNDPLCQ